MFNDKRHLLIVTPCDVDVKYFFSNGTIDPQYKQIRCHSMFTMTFTMNNDGKG